MPFSSQFGFEQFVEATTMAMSKERLFEILLEAAACFGFDGVNLSILQDWQLAPAHMGSGLINTYPSIWVDEYTERRLGRIDPVAQCAIGTFGGFWWRDLNRLLGLTSVQSAFLKRADKAGLHHGLGLPFTGSGAQIGGIALATSSSLLKRPVNLGLLMAFANQFYKEYKRVVGVVAIDKPHGISLSERQKEVLRRIGHGRTNAEISEAMKIRPRTVETHVRTAFEKLDVNSRAEAVYVALNYGLISPEPRVFTR